MVLLQVETPSEAQLCGTYRYHSSQCQLSYTFMSINRCVYVYVTSVPMLATHVHTFMDTIVLYHIHQLTLLTLNSTTGTK